MEARKKLKVALLNLHVHTTPKVGNSVSRSVVSPTLCNLMNCSLPGSSVYGILQARIQEWVAMTFSRGSSQPRDLPRSPALWAV